LNFAPINDPHRAAYLSGAVQQTPVAVGLLLAMLVLHILGLIDDRQALGPYLKLLVQFAVTAALVIAFKDIRALTALGPAASITLTVLWIVAITNAFNFLDNMDGLSSGVASVCATAFFITTILIQQWFVAASLAILLGALLGFLYWNFPPAKIFMGDSGSLVIGFVLGVLTIRTTYLQPGTPLAAGWYSVFAPVIVLAVPLYDLIVVSIIRLLNGKSPFVGDTNHFSHRLVARGMSRRTAVLCIYLVTAATAIAAILLPHVQSTFAAILIFAQTILVLGVVAILEQHPLPDEK
jgi:UDP-GlcNAc:undecaprenyl-phosphate/decaprenyl-phosphate GlcNAc-1-phosphate transferase